MKRVFSKPASTAGSEGVDDRHSDNPSFAGEIAADGPVGGIDRETALLAVDRVIRSLKLREPLERVAPAETLDPGCPACHHPDSEAVVCSCQRRHPAWKEFPDHTIRVVYQRLLRDRWESTIFARISQEPPSTVNRVIDQVTAFVPAGQEPGDEWLAWFELEKSCPQKDYCYMPSQIRGAWRRVSAARQRIDSKGKSSRLPQVRRLRRSAIAPLSADLHRPPSKVTVLDVDDYDAVVGTVLLRGESNVAIIQVSLDTQKRVDDWLTVRGCAAGLLFALPDLPPYNEQPYSDLPGLIEFPSAENESAVDYRSEVEELIELCCQAQSANLGRYLFWKLLKWGDWPAEVLETICDLAGIEALEGTFHHGLSKKQVHRCRKKLRERLDRMGIRQKAWPYADT